MAFHSSLIPSLQSLIPLFPFELLKFSLSSIIRLSFHHGFYFSTTTKNPSHSEISCHCITSRYQHFLKANMWMTIKVIWLSFSVEHKHCLCTDRIFQAYLWDIFNFFYLKWELGHRFSLIYHWDISILHVGNTSSYN